MPTSRSLPLVFALSAGASLVFGGASHAAPALSERYQVSASVAVKSALNLRSGPGTRHRVLRKLKPGARLVTLQRTRRTEKRPEFTSRFRWYHVRLVPAAAKPVEGWVYGAYLAIGGRNPVKRAIDRAPLEKLAKKGAGLLKMPDKSRLAWMLDKAKSYAKAAYEKAKAAAKGFLAAPTKKPTTKPAAKPNKPTKPSAPSKPSATQAQQTSLPAGGLDIAKSLAGFAYYNQGDPRWGKKKIATSESRTIQQIGCALSSAAMAIQFFGKKLDPAQLNDTLVRNKGFVGVLINFGAAVALAGRKVADSLDASLGWEGNHERAMRFVREHFATKKEPMIGQVDYQSDTDSRGDHFVLITGVDAGGDPIIYDPGARANQGKPLAKVETHKGYLLLRVLRLPAKSN